MSAIVQHSTLTDPNLHEPKGAAAAGSGQVFVADGAGSGSFQTLAMGVSDHGALTGLADDDHTQYLTEARLAAYLDRHQVTNTTPADNDTTTFADFINQSFVLQNAATYKVTVQFYWSCNDGAQDFISRLLYDGVAVSAQVHQQEPKDTAGAGPFGTNQRHLGVITAFVTGTAASHTFQFQHAGSATNDSCAIYEANLYVERWV